MKAAAPLALLLALLTHTALAWTAPGLYRLLWWPHLAGYLLIGAAMWQPGLQRVTLLRLGVTFAHLNLFVVQGFLAFLKQKQGHLWSSSTASGSAK